MNKLDSEDRIELRKTAEGRAALAIIQELENRIVKLEHATFARRQPAPTGASY